MIASPNRGEIDFDVKVGAFTRLATALNEIEYEIYLEVLGIGIFCGHCEKVPRQAINFKK